MAETNKEPTSENIRSVSERWMDKIYDNLNRAEELERIAKSGYRDINTFLSPEVSFMDQRCKDNIFFGAKAEALNLIEMEFETIEISGGNVLFSKEFLETFHSKMDEIRKYSKEELYYVKRIRTNSNPNKPTNGPMSTLTPKFYEKLNKICELRKLLVAELRDTLFLTKQKSQTEGRL